MSSASKCVGPGQRETPLTSRYFLICPTSRFWKLSFQPYVQLQDVGSRSRTLKRLTLRLTGPPKSCAFGFPPCCTPRRPVAKTLSRCTLVAGRGTIQAYCITDETNWNRLAERSR